MRCSTYVDYFIQFHDTIIWIDKKNKQAHVCHEIVKITGPKTTVKFQVEPIFSGSDTDKTLI